MTIEGGHSECIGVFGVFLRQLFAKRQIQALSRGELYSVVGGTIVCRWRNYSLFGLFLQGIVTQVGVDETYIRKGRYILS